MKREEAKKMEVGSKDLLISYWVEINSKGTLLIFMDLQGKYFLLNQRD
jgi:hypothetical protein